jgi:CHAT domain-containing protein
MTEGESPGETSQWTRALYEQEGLRVSSIPFSNAEAKSVMRRAGPGSRLFTGEEASEQRAKTEQLNRFRVIHFATHGLISQQAPLRSALVLAAGKAGGEDGFLQAREVCQLRLSCDLVVLSACRTARGRVLSGEGVEGLASAFFYAGAKSVVASLWDVTDAGTATFMTSFYDHLAKGRSKSEALREAKLDLLRNPETAQPRHWSPFVLIGEGTRMVPIGLGTTQGRERFWVLVGVLGIAAGFAFYWKRQRLAVRR